MYSAHPHHPAAAPPGISRYGSAPGSLLKSLVNSVVDDGDFSASAAAVGSESLLGRYFSGDSSCLTAESSCKADCNVSPSDFEDVKRAKMSTTPTAAAAAVNCSMGLERSSSYGINEMGAMGDFAAAAAAAAGSNLKPGPSSSSPLIRHSSSPAGFLNHFNFDTNGGGYSVARGLGSYSCRGGGGGNGTFVNGTLKPQLSFSRQDSLSQISEISISDVSDNVLHRNGSEDMSGNSGQPYMSGSFRMGSWDDTNSIIFSSSPRKRKDINGEIAAALSSVDSEFNMPNKTMDMAAVEKFLHIQQDSVACKIRAKRGCATHPRSIAERDRRTRISEKLRKLQELMPNMDKQTNTAEMLDLAVQHIKSLQGQLQDLQQERANCTCASRHAVHRS